MTSHNNELEGKVALITGAARRIGAAIAQILHAEGMNLVLHYHSSREAAHALQQQFNSKRENSAVLFQTDLLHTGKLNCLIRDAEKFWGRLDVLVNNASTFYPTPVGSITEDNWDDVIGTNLKAPLFLSQAAAPALERQGGCIVNITDVHGDRPLKTYNVYSVAKAGLVMLTRALARDLGPKIRVNAVAPGAIMWPEHGLDDVAKHRILSRTALKRQGEPADVARAVLFLIRDADYVSGQVIAVDGGRSLHS